jgi:type II secretory pathway component GspD/PulD (secretin)
MVSRQFVSGRKALLSLLLVLFCLPMAGFAQSSDQDEKKVKVARSIVFKDVPLKTALGSIGKELELNVVFDESIKDLQKITIELKEVTLEAAMKIIFVQQQLQARLIEKRTIIIFADNLPNRERFSEHKPWPAKSDQSN